MNVATFSQELYPQNILTPFLHGVLIFMFFCALKQRSNFDHFCTPIWKVKDLLSNSY